MSKHTTRTSARTTEKLLARYRSELARGVNPFKVFESLIAFASNVVLDTEDDEDLDEATAAELREVCIDISESVMVAMARHGLATEVEGHLDGLASARAKDVSDEVLHTPDGSAAA